MFSKSLGTYTHADVQLHLLIFGSTGAAASNCQQVQAWDESRVGLGVFDSMLGPTLPLMPEQASLFISGAPLDGPLKYLKGNFLRICATILDFSFGQHLWQMPADIVEGCAFRGSV